MANSYPQDQITPTAARLRHVDVWLLLFLFFDISFPRAGIKVAGTYPVVVGNVLLLLASAARILVAGRRGSSALTPVARRIQGALIALVMVLSACTAISVVEYGLGPSLAIGVPLIMGALAGAWLLPLVSALNGPTRERLLRIFIGIAVGYALAQELLGRVNTVIPGLSVNWTDWHQLGSFVFISKDNSTAEGLKLVGSYQNGNLFGELFVLFLPFLFLKAISVRGRERVWWGVLTASGVACLVLTFSRGAVLCAVVSLAVAVVVLGRGRATFALMLSIGLPIVFAAGSVAERLTNFNSAGRNEVLSVWFHEVGRLPALLLGRMLVVGLGPGYDALRNATPAGRLAGGMVPETQSGIVNILMFFGIVGLIAWFRPIVMTIRRVRKNMRSQASASSRVRSAAWIGGLVGESVHMLIEQSIALPPTAVLIMIVVAFAAAELSDEGGPRAASIERSVNTGAVTLDQERVESAWRR
jgi:hypothetical protein